MLDSVHGLVREVPDEVVTRHAWLKVAFSVKEVQSFILALEVCLEKYVGRNISMDLMDGRQC